MRIRVGVDVGTNSVGCCALTVDEAGVPMRILSCLSLIHDSGIGEDGQKTASSRREVSGVARRARRLLRRRRKRLQQLDTLLERRGYPIVDTSAQKDPYLVWRVRAQLAQEVLPNETRKYALSMVLRHIARHRGWRNPYANAQSLLSPAPESEFMRAMRQRVMEKTGEVLDENITPGQAMASTALSTMVPMRGPNGVLGKLHQTDNAHEIRRICEQQGISAEECKELILAVFASESPRGSASKRVASDPLPGQGAHKRAPKCDPEFQRFRIISVVANLRIAESEKPARPLSPDERRRVVDFLLESTSEDLAWTDIAELLGIRRQNLRGTATTAADGERSSAQPPTDATNRIMSNCNIKTLRSWWKRADADRRTAMVKCLYEGAEDSECANFLGNLPEEEQGKLDSLHLPAGRAAYSPDSLARLNDQMLRTADDLHDARKHVFGVDDTWRPPAESIGAPVGNPSVDRTVKAVARFLNAVDDVWGTPDTIQIEHVRDGFMSERTAREIDRENNRRFKQNQDTVAEIQKIYGIQGEVHRSDVMRYTAVTQQDCACVYCGGTITYLSCQLDHIIPQAGIGSNNHRENLVAVCERCNRSKSNIPFAVWAEKCGIPGVSVEEAIARVRKWRNTQSGRAQAARLKKLQKDVIARLRRTDEDPAIDARSMESVSWMANELHHRVKAAYPSADVAVYRGSITAGARRAAGIDSRVNLLGERGRKDRLDRRHHAVDAAVIAMMTPGIAKTLGERSNLRWAERLSGGVETWKSFTGATPGARESFEAWRNRMLRLTELLNLALAEDRIHVTENLRLRLGSGKAHGEVQPLKLHQLGNGLTPAQIDRASSPALWCALTREPDFDIRKGLPASETRIIRVHGRRLTADDSASFFSKKSDDSKEKPFAAISVRGGFAEIGSTIHHARIYRINGRKPVYAMLRVFTQDLLPYRNSDLFSAPVPLQSISVRCAEPKLKTAISAGTATYLGWVVTGDELEVPMESFTTGTIGEFRKDFPTITRWRIRGFFSATRFRLRPSTLASEGLSDANDSVKKILTIPGWLISINGICSVHPTVARRDSLGRIRSSSSVNLPVSWTIL